MSLCINPDCPASNHPDNHRGIICQGCGSDLILQGRYRVMRLISSQTGFGTVYEAYERNIPKILKVLRRDRSQNPKVLRLFQQEAQVLSRIRHPGVPFVEVEGYFTVLPKGQTLPLHCIVMEKIEGLNLKQWMQQQGNHPISEHQAIQWLTQLTEILQRVHHHNYFHRDIKPDNVMLRHTGQLVLVDFGAAREMTQTYLAQVGNSGVTTLSSTGYTPPEQEQGQAVPQSDFFALGRTMIFLLTARSPNDSAIYDPLLNAFNWRIYAPQISPEFAALLEALVAPRVIDRPRTAQEILDRLHQLPLARWVSQQQAATVLPETTLPARSEMSATVPNTDLPTATDLEAELAAIAPEAAPDPAAAPPPTVPGWQTRKSYLIGGGLVLVALVMGGIALRDRAQIPAPPPASVTEAAPEIATVAALPERSLLGHTNSINDLLLLSNRRELLSASADRTIRHWDVTTGETLQTFTSQGGFVNAIALSPDESVLYSGSANGTLEIWSMTTGALVRQISAHPGPINTLERLPDGQLIVTGGSDGTIKIWEAGTGMAVRSLAGHRGAVNTLVITADGQHIISGGADRTIRIWEVSTGEELRVLEGHDSFINAIAVSPDGRILFSASADQTIRRWDLSTDTILETLTAHTSYVNILVLSRDGQVVISGGADATIRIWDIKTGELRQVFTDFGMPVDHLTLLADQQVITASRENPDIRLWRTVP